MRLFLCAVPAALVALVACSSSDSTPAATTDTDPPHLYKENVYPILQVSCALSACHGASQDGSGLGPPLGVHISPSDPEDAYKSLVGKASTRFVGTNLVQPGDPDNSLVMRKMDGTQAQLKSCPGDCGKSMPPPDDSEPTSTDQLLSQKKRDTVRAWIKDGAKDD